MKAVLHFSSSPALRQRWRTAAPPWLVLSFVDDGDETGLVRELADADVLLHVLSPASAARIAVAPRLRLIQKIGVGINTIDLDAARRRGIRVANMPGTNTRAVCEATLALMLAVLRRVAVLDAATRRGDGWSLDPSFLDDVGEIAGRTVGLIGFGAVPRQLAPVLSALGAHVLFHARRRIDTPSAVQVGLDDLLARADIVSLHLPLDDTTRGLIDARAIARMRRGAILVNTARGALVDEAALVEALRAGHLRGAGLDVFATEPAGADQPLFDLPNVVVTPHVAWLTAETLERSFAVIVENCTRLRDGRDLLNDVDR